jgi:hypothetical protein
MLRLLTNVATNVATNVVSMIQRIYRTLASLQAQKVAVIAFVGLFLLTTSIDSADLNSRTKATLNDIVEQGANGRPMTTRQWKNENESLQGKPAEQAKEIAKESADAIKKMGKIYPENARTLLPGMENRSSEAGDR